jgi:hypothetical protein
MCDLDETELLLNYIARPRFLVRAVWIQPTNKKFELKPYG